MPIFFLLQLSVGFFCQNFFNIVFFWTCIFLFYLPCMCRVLYWEVLILPSCLLGHAMLASFVLILSMMVFFCYVTLHQKFWYSNMKSHQYYEQLTETENDTEIHIHTYPRYHRVVFWKKDCKIYKRSTADKSKSAHKRISTSGYTPQSTGSVRPNRNTRKTSRTGYDTKY